MVEPRALGEADHFPVGEAGSPKARGQTVGNTEGAKTGQRPEGAGPDRRKTRARRRQKGSQNNI